ncbi:MAG TPA: hypothetical protein VG817_07790, partial [Gemmatimonadales bacterium]|nr:hypothetical protein [Gemmatimonadales bacterium]
LTDAVRTALEAQRDALAPGDIVRMLKLLGDAEATLRRSVNPRLAVETLLLRWAMMDRTVDLAAVLQGGGEPSGGSAAPQGGSASARLGGSASSPAARSSEPTASRFSAEVRAQLEAAEPPSRRTAEPPSRGFAEPPSRPVSAVNTVIDWSLAGLLAAWSDLIRAAREQSRFLGEAVSHARPVALSGDGVTLAVPGGNDMHMEALTRQREAVETLLSQARGQAVRLQLTTGGEASASAAPPRRLTEGQARAERLRVLKGRDPALEAAADSLDLEVLE